VISGQTWSPPPPVPVVYSVNPVSAFQMNVTWQNVNNETSYTLYRNSVNDSNTATPAGGRPANVTNFSDSGLTPVTWYFYWIRSFNGAGRSGLSAVVSNQTLAPPPPPSSPFWVSAIPVSQSQIDLKWTTQPTSTSYTLFYSLVNNTNFISRVAGTGLNITNYSPTGLSADTVYYYWVKAYNISGGSGFSTTISARTWPLPPGTPVIYSVQSVSPNQLSITWQNMNNETGYTLYRNTSRNSNTAAIAGNRTVDNTNFMDNALTPSTWYYYWVKSFNGPSSSGFPQSCPIKPSPLLPLQPRRFS